MWDACNRKNIKSAIKENITAARNNTFKSIAMETGISQAKERIEYSTLMLIHSIINSNKERISQKSILEKIKKGMPNTLYEKAKKKR